MSDKPVLVPDKPWEKVALMCPHVLWDEQAKLYRMWYSGGEQYEPNAIGFATSPDGLAWTKHEQNPIFTGDRRSPGSRTGLLAARWKRRGDWYLMFYIGFRDIDHAQIGIARSRDGITAMATPPGQPHRAIGHRQVGRRRLLQALRHLRRPEMAALVQRPAPGPGADRRGHPRGRGPGFPPMILAPSKSLTMPRRISNLRPRILICREGGRFK